MRHPKVETWAWSWVIAPPIPGAISPERAFTSCQPLIRSSNSNPAPLVDRKVAGGRFSPLAGDAFGFDFGLDGDMFFQMLKLGENCHAYQREVSVGRLRPGRHDEVVAGVGL